MPIRTEAFFLSMPGRGERFCLLNSPSEGKPPRGAVLYIHPFAEEMNKSRRMAAMAARSLAEQGWAVMRIDLLGCGDSSGDFADATWTDWVTDVVEAECWLKDRFSEPVWLWGLRAGALIASDALRRIGDGPRLLLWQPVLSGKQHLTQFLRLKLAGEMLGDATQRTGTEDLRKRFLAGETIEIAGYGLSPALTLEMDKAEFRLPELPTRVAGLEVSPQPESTLSPALATRVSRWQELGHTVRAIAVTGPGFWQAQEIEICPELIRRTLEVLDLMEQ